MLEMPFGGDDGRAETLDLVGIVDQLGVEVAQIPLEQHPPDIEDDRAPAHHPAIPAQQNRPPDEPDGGLVTSTASAMRRAISPGAP